MRIERPRRGHSGAILHPAPRRPHRHHVGPCGPAREAKPRTLWRCGHWPRMRHWAWRGPASRHRGARRDQTGTWRLHPKHLHNAFTRGCRNPKGHAAGTPACVRHGHGPFRHQVSGQSLSAPRGLDGKARGLPLDQCIGACQAQGRNGERRPSICHASAVGCALQS